MDIKLFFNPLESKKYSNKTQWETTQIGRNIHIHTDENFPSLESADIVIFSCLEYFGSKNEVSKSDQFKFRDQLYKLHYKNLPAIVDLGDFIIDQDRKQNFKNLQIVCEFLIKKGKLPFIVGGGNDLTYALYKAYAKLNRFITLTCIDSDFNLGLEGDVISSESFFGKILSHKPNHLFQFNNLAYQSYLVSPLALDMMQSLNFDAYRLAEIQENPKELEPIMRNTDLLSFDISAVSSAYSSANYYSNPNGLTGQEACKVFRYAGISDKISSVMLSEYNQNLDENNQTSSLMAQMIWYFIDGYVNRMDELNPKIKDCIKYTVAYNDGKNQITFYKSLISGRWWMGVPFQKKHVSSQIYYVACSYSDYELAMHGDIPKKWLKTFNKFL